MTAFSVISRGIGAAPRESVKKVKKVNEVDR
jgi:hypothetical protein